MAEEYDSEYEQQELQQEVEAQIRAWGKAIVDNPALQQVMRSAQEQVRAIEPPPPCPRCVQKRAFVQCVQTLTIVHMLTVPQSHAYHLALGTALRVPATCLPSQDAIAISDAAGEFFEWRCRGGAQPAWYPGEPLHADGHE